jgi:hypothetical protein
MGGLFAVHGELTAEEVADVFASSIVAVVVPLNTVFDCIRVPLEKRSACGNDSLSERRKEQC